MSCAEERWNPQHLVAGSEDTVIRYANTLSRIRDDDFVGRPVCIDGTSKPTRSIERRLFLSSTIGASTRLTSGSPTPLMIRIRSVGVLIPSITSIRDQYACAIAESGTSSGTVGGGGSGREDRLVVAVRCSWFAAGDPGGREFSRGVRWTGPLVGDRRARQFYSHALCLR